MAAPAWTKAVLAAKRKAEASLAAVSAGAAVAPPEQAGSMAYVQQAARKALERDASLSIRASVATGHARTVPDAPKAAVKKQFFHRALLGAVSMNRKQEEKHYEHWAKSQMERIQGSGRDKSSRDRDRKRSRSPKRARSRSRSRSGSGDRSPTRRRDGGRRSLSPQRLDEGAKVDGSGTRDHNHTRGSSNNARVGGQRQAGKEGGACSEGEEGGGCGASENALSDSFIQEQIEKRTQERANRARDREQSELEVRNEHEFRVVASLFECLCAHHSARAFVCALVRVSIGSILFLMTWFSVYNSGRVSGAATCRRKLGSKETERPRKR